MVEGGQWVVEKAGVSDHSAGAEDEVEGEQWVVERSGARDYSADAEDEVEGLWTVERA
jgi:hypothetical protein